MKENDSLKSRVEDRFLCRGKPSRWATGAGIAIGLGAGVALGTANGNLTVGIAVGIAFGVAIDFVGSRANK